MDVAAVIFRFLPLLFGIGFTAPLVAAVLTRLGLDAPLGLTPIAFGLIVGIAWGGFATKTGRWI